MYKKPVPATVVNAFWGSEVNNEVNEEAAKFNKQVDDYLTTMQANANKVNTQSMDDAAAVFHGVSSVPEHKQV